MKKRSQYHSVAEMARSLSDDKSFLSTLDEHFERRQLVKALAVLRAKEGITQADVAKSIHCTQAKVSKLESGEDAEARFGDLVAYTEAVGHEMRISLVPKGQTMVEQVKTHALIIDRLLQEMVRMATGDGTITVGVAKFFDEAAFNLADIVCAAAEALPSRARPDGPTLQVEAPPHENGSVEDQRPQRRRRRDGRTPIEKGS